jgi:hypothetical protein
MCMVFKIFHNLPAAPSTPTTGTPIMCAGCGVDATGLPPGAPMGLPLRSFTDYGAGHFQGLCTMGKPEGLSP